MYLLHTHTHTLWAARPSPSLLVVAKFPFPLLFDMMMILKTARFGPLNLVGCSPALPSPPLPVKKRRPAAACACVDAGRAKKTDGGN